MLSERRQSENSVHCMIPALLYSGKVYEDSKYNRGFQGCDQGERGGGMKGGGTLLHDTV